MTTDARAEGRSAGAVVPPGAVVAGLDELTGATAALDWAVDEAVLRGRPLVLVHALDPEGSRSVARAESARLLDDATAHVRHRAGPSLDLHRHVAEGDPTELLVTLSSGACAIVLGSRGRGAIRSTVLGSVSVGVSKQAACPVIVHRPHAHPGLVRHGVAVGSSATGHSPHTLAFAYDAASLRGWPLTVIHAVWDAEAMVSTPHLVTGAALLRLESERLQLAEAMAGLAEEHPDVRARVLVARGLPEECLTTLGARMHLLVVGRERQPRRLARPTAVSVIENADCPVAVVPTLSPSTTERNPS